MNIIFLGPPGAGKGTQAIRVSRVLGVPQISTGDILRGAMRDGTPTGLKAKGYVEKGHLVPDEVVIDIVRERLQEPDCKEGYILDGFPRTVPQAQALGAFAEIDAVVNIDVMDEELVERISGRRMCPACNATFHVSTLQGELCSFCQAQVVQRKDDEPETVRNRLKVYHEQTAPLINYYMDAGILQTIDGSQTPDECFEAIMVALGVNR